MFCTLVLLVYVMQVNIFTYCADWVRIVVSSNMTVLVTLTLTSFSKDHLFRLKKPSFLSVSGYAVPFVQSRNNIFITMDIVIYRFTHCLAKLRPRTSCCVQSLVGVLNRSVSYKQDGTSLK